MRRIEISFITSLFDCLDYTKAYLASLEATVTGLNYEVILIDDASRDETPRYLQTLPDPPYRIIRNEENVGFARSNNIGAAHARGRYLCLLNNDLILRQGWLEPMLELLESEPNVGAVGNLQIDPRTALLDHAGVFFDPRGVPTHAWQGRGRIPPGVFGEWNAVTAACLLIPAARFHEIGGFDEGYRNSYEDVDLCVRLRARGYRLLVSHRSVIEHHGRASPGRKRHDPENRARFLERWVSTTAAWGNEEWPRQYLHLYARRWWSADPLRLARALWMLATRR